MDGPITLGVAPETVAGPMTTADSATSGRLKVDASARKGKKAILKRKVNNAIQH